jgi:type 1 glutamine amidotransferase
MKYIKYGEKLNVLISVKGHPFDREAFAAIFEEMDGIAASFVDQPAAARMMNPAAMADFDALVLYDMPGLNFLVRRADRPAYVDPPDWLKAGFQALTEQGKGIVALHHAIAGWPTWRDYGDALGGRFLYRHGPVRDVEKLDSGYRHDVSYDAIAIDPAHPVLAGLPERFPITDEAYLFETFDAEVTPLLRAGYPAIRENFYSSEFAVRQSRMYDNEGWDHPPGSGLIGWTKRARNSPLVYLQPGDGPPTYSNPHYRRLVENAIRWVASPEARRG